MAEFWVLNPPSESPCFLFIPWAKTCRNNWRDRTKPFLYLVFFEEQPGHVRVATLNGVHEGREATPVSAVRFVLAPGAQTQSNSWEQSLLQTLQRWLWPTCLTEDPWGPDVLALCSCLSVWGAHWCPSKPAPPPTSHSILGTVISPASHAELYSRPLSLTKPLNSPSSM